ncbi:zinc finger C2H2 type [Echinococcus multilocularis]|uniref:Zinc finger C2H2 type n=1 Tax=Echinococcus multilocularis TaxID=6211 RepID=A0A068YG31_ECHMU|nr:zinc finger C2H2 type [Echinococcus multilocularis]
MFQVHQVRPRGRCPICLTYRDTAGLTLLHQRASNHNTCFLCLTPFGQFDFLLLHFIVVHIFQKVGESELRLYCPECYTDYSTWDEMQEHIRSQHLYMWIGLFAQICLLFISPYYAALTYLARICTELCSQRVDLCRIKHELSHPLLFFPS